MGIFFTKKSKTVYLQGFWPKSVYLKCFGNQLKTVHLQGPHSSRPCISRPCCISKRAHEISKILFSLGLKKFLACLECVKSYAWSFSHSDPDPSSVSLLPPTYNSIIEKTFLYHHTWFKKSFQCTIGSFCNFCIDHVFSLLWILCKVPLIGFGAKIALDLCSI